MADVLAACDPGCGWNGEVVLTHAGWWTCPKCWQRREWRDHRGEQFDGSTSQ